MGLTIDDIYDKEFAKAGSGYDRDDVDQFLDEICDEMISMQERIDRLGAELEKAKAEAAEAVKPVPQPVVERPREAAPVAQTSQTLEGILLSAQRLADEAVENAKNRAATIVKEAEDKASSIVDDAQEERATLSKELDGLRKNAAEYKKSFLQLLDKHRSVIEDVKDVFDGDDK